MKKSVRLTLAAAAVVLLLALGACGKSCDHSFGAQVVKKEPTCQEDGLAVQTCEKCGEEKEVVLAALSHDYESQVTKEPSCGEEGVLTKTCKRCGDSKTETIPAAGEHSYEETVTKAPTCVETGEKTRTCTVCGHVENETMATADHQYEVISCEEATCTKDGHKVQTCAVCQHTVEETMPATGEHKWVDASCTSPKHCESCGLEEGTALGHSWQNAACTAPKTCTRCGKTEGSALGHTTGLGICDRCGGIGNALAPLAGDIISADSSALDYIDKCLKYIKSGSYTTALTTSALASGRLGAVIDLCGDHPEFAAVKQNAQAARAELQKLRIYSTGSPSVAIEILEAIKAALPYLESNGAIYESWKPYL